MDKYSRQFSNRDAIAAQKPKKRVKSEPKTNRKKGIFLVEAKKTHKLNTLPYEYCRAISLLSKR